MTNILIHSPCGGNGITTITANLGVALARNGHPALISERSEGTVAKHFEHWNPVVAQHDLPLFHGVRKVQVDNLLFVTNDRSHAHARGPTGGHSSGIYQHSEQFTLVESSSNQLPDTNELSNFHFLVVVVCPDASSFSGLARLLTALCQAIKTTTNFKLLVVLNNYIPESMISRDIHYLLKTSLLQSFYHETFLNDESVKEALACGIPLAEHAPYSPVSSALDTFAQYLIRWSD